MAYGLSEINQNGVEYRLNDPNIANEFSTLTAYSVGDYVNYNGLLYRFNAAHPAGAWNASQVVEVKVGDEVTNLKSAIIYSETEYESFFTNATLIHGSNYGSSLGTQEFRVTFKDFISFDQDILLFISDGFKAYVPVQNTDGTYNAGTTQRKQLFVPKGTKFSVIIMRETEDTSEIADITEFASNCKFKRMDIPTRLNYIDGFYKTNNVYNKKYVSYATGALTDAGSYFNVYEFTNPTFKHIKVQSSLYNKDPAVIAFYSNDVYDSSHSVQSTAYGDVQWAEADIPDGCDKVLVTSRTLHNDDSPFKPTILISDESDKLNNYFEKTLDVNEINIEYGYINGLGVRSDQNYVKRAVTDLFEYANPYVSISVDSEKGFQFSLTEYYNGNTRKSTSWKTSFSGQLYCDKFAIGIKRVVNNADVDLTTTTKDDIGLSVSVRSYKTFCDVSSINEKTNGIKETIKKKSNAQALGNVLFNGYKYCSHIFIDSIESNEPTIPCQSIFDIEIAHRLGYKMVELNVHKTATSGKFVVMHGNSGKIGNQLKALDGTDISNLSFENVSYEDFKTKYVYRSKYEKYQVPVTDLEEALYACKKYNIIPFIMYAYDVNQIDVIRSIVGNNFVLYIGSTYYATRYFFDGAMQLYTGISDVDTVKSICKNMGAPFMYSLSPETISSLSDEQIKTVVKTVHDEGCLIGFAGAYQSPVTNNKLLEMGFDYSGTGWDVEYFTDGNLGNYYADTNFSDFNYEGTVSNTVLSLANGQSIYKEINTTPFLSKAILKIQFTGALYIEMGQYIRHIFSSDGRNELVLSTYFIESAPNFRATANGNVTVISCSYNTSVC